MTRFTAASFVILSLLSGCSHQPTDPPPRVRYGQDECAFCGMIISDERFAAALRVNEKGEIRDLLFDDIGDMIDYEKANPGIAVVHRFVHDLSTRRWIDAQAATYSHSDQLQTPMGSGIAAFADEHDAAAHSEANRMRYQDLTAARQAAQKVAGRAGL
jgi:copper chaperone NosL